MGHFSKNTPFWAAALLALIGVFGQLAGVWEALVDWIRSQQQREYYQLQRLDGDRTVQVNQNASFVAVINQTTSTNAITYRWMLKKPSGDFEPLLDNNSSISINLPCSSFSPGTYAIKVETTLSGGSNSQEKSVQFRVDPYPSDQNENSAWNINDPCANVKLPKNVVVGETGLNIVAARVSAHVEGTHISARNDMSARAPDGENGSRGISYNSKAGRGDHGHAGGDGSDGLPGTQGATAPDASISATTLSGAFSFDLRGQNGGYGGAGGAGGNGQDGGDGRNGVSGALGCNRGPQSGRNGGLGGSGGNGGAGGPGGNAGDVLIEVGTLADVFSIEADLEGGRGGFGGPGGPAGTGGAGGARGSAPGHCDSGGRGSGSPGSAGQRGTDHSAQRAEDGIGGSCKIRTQSGVVTSCHEENIGFPETKAGR
ncbi:hypothetical protein SSPSH_000019 [Salinisphaera shabanensis E1L3A]|uniref:Uncharacterized protein n=1 Tax=Salinisphaera shabanensis E1L3A TaxID=1033802 RepID=U2ERQ3_9GAMM|nr:hypothetical protein [Salinisphaera shabanensis]ERJ20682.1 hypothetical protein SSPSH_000019 [Salinisphaera shabanensis E1L3A]